MTFPILVAKWPTHPNASLQLGCNGCGHVWSEADPEDAMAKNECGVCPRCGTFDIAFRYEEGVACKNCGKLDHEMPVEGCCSRACLLQAEYAKTLAGDL